MLVPLIKAIQNVELMQVCYSQHLLIYTVRIKQDKETGEEKNQKQVNFEKN